MPKISCLPLDSGKLVGTMSESARVEKADPGCITKSSELYGQPSGEEDARFRPVQQYNRETEARMDQEARELSR